MHTATLSPEDIDAQKSEGEAEDDAFSAVFVTSFRPSGIRPGTCSARDPSREQKGADACKLCRVCLGLRAKSLLGYSYYGLEFKGLRASGQGFFGVGYLAAGTAANVHNPYIYLLPTEHRGVNLV